MQPSLIDRIPAHDGPDLHAADQVRLSITLQRVVVLMSDQRWRTLKEIAAAVGCSEAGASARLRDLRKKKFGAFTVERQRVDAWSVYRVKL